MSFVYTLTSRNSLKLSTLTHVVSTNIVGFFSNEEPRVRLRQTAWQETLWECELVQPWILRLRVLRMEQRNDMSSSLRVMTRIRGGTRKNLKEEWIKWSKFYRELLRVPRAFSGGPQPTRLAGIGNFRFSDRPNLKLLIGFPIGWVLVLPILNIPVSAGQL